MPFHFAELMVKHMEYREAIASVSLSHREDCPCTVCRAAQGDEESFMEIVDMLERDGKKPDVQVRKDVGD